MSCLEYLPLLILKIQPISEGDSDYDAYTREKLVLDSKGNKILITSEGFMVTQKKASGNTYYDYVTEPAEEGYEYILKVDNDGNIIDKVSRKVAAE